MVLPRVVPKKRSHTNLVSRISPLGLQKIQLSYPMNLQFSLITKKQWGNVPCLLQTVHILEHRNKRFRDNLRCTLISCMDSGLNPLPSPPLPQISLSKLLNPWTIQMDVSLVAGSILVSLSCYTVVLLLYMQMF